ncbi:MAG TPA: hypothetical protein VEK15_20890 [Vicinamibacteria bacterium]|nr:hypothetical protein [Vicinamibacteria bacterium]
MQPNVSMTMTVTFHEGRPFIESRLRPLDDRNGPIPKGKMLVLRTPILPPGASEQEIRAATERKLEPL